MSLVGSLQRLLTGIAPWYLAGKNVSKFLESVALTQDASLESLIIGLKMTRPLECDASALPALSSDRGIRLYGSEPDASKRQRLARWKRLHRQRGTHQGEMRHAQPYFLPGALPVMRIVHQAGDATSATWHTLAADGTYSVHDAVPSNWNFDGVTWKKTADIQLTTAIGGSAIGVDTLQPHGLADGQPARISGVLGDLAANTTAKITYLSPTGFSIPVANSGIYLGGGIVEVNMWSRFWAILYPPAGFQDLRVYDDGTLYDGGPWWDGISAATGVDLVSMIRDWKAAHSELWGFIMCSDPTALDPAATATTLADGSTSLPTGNWGRIIDPITGQPTRPPYAEFLFDSGQA